MVANLRSSPVHQHPMPINPSNESQGNSQRLPAITITAAHRESLARSAPAAYTMIQSQQPNGGGHFLDPSQKQVGSTAKTHNSQPQAKLGKPRSTKKSEEFDRWMAAFCVEPPNDSDACCLAFWAPCVQYGKTHWRLKQLEDGKDGSDASWRPGYGCNGPCWAWYGMCYIFQCDCISSSPQK